MQKNTLINQIEKQVRLKYADKPDRLKHIEGVVEKSVELAKLYHADLDACMIAAWFHDYTKYDSVEKQCIYLTQDEIKTYQRTPVIYHAISAAKVLEIDFGIKDEVILTAIKKHVWGDISMSLVGKILLAADKTERNRTFKGVDHLRALAAKNLDDFHRVFIQDLYKIFQIEDKYMHAEFIEIKNHLEGVKING